MASQGMDVLCMRYTMELVYETNFKKKVLKKKNTIGSDEESTLNVHLC